MTSSKRIKWLDFGKGLTILFVVLFHCIQAASPRSLLVLNILGTFIMPIFFAISGYLYSPSYSTKGYILLLYKKISSFLIPYLVFFCITCILDVTGMLSFTPWKLSLISLINSINSIKPIAYLWFLYYLFFIFIIISSIFYLYKGKNYLCKILSVVLLVGSLFLGYQVGLKNLLCWIICFLIGYIIKYIKSPKYYSLIKLVLPTIFLWIIIFSVQFANETSKNKLSGSDFFNRYDILTKFWSIITFFIIFKVFENNRFFNYFCKYGKITLVIYLIHFPIFIIIDNIIRIFIDLNIFVGICVFVVTWMLSILIFQIFNRNSIFHFIFYPRKYINRIILNTKWGKWLLY